MKIGIALSGGGALGAAHIGALEMINKEGIKIDQVCGTSAGAIIGLLYSAGGVEKIHDFINDMEKAGLLSRKNILIKRNSSIFETIENLLRQNISASKFLELNIKFSCFATDIITGESKHFEYGDPVQCVMASAAYPGVFPIQKVESNFYVDGGLTKNLPVEPLRKAGMDFVIGSSLYSVSKLDSIEQSDQPKIGLLTTAIRSIDILSKELANIEAKKCDFCFYPKVESFNWYNFEKIHEIIEVGRLGSLERLEELRKALDQKANSAIDKNIWQSLFHQ